LASVISGTVVADPAVSEFNTKLSLQGLSLDGKGAGIGTGGFTAPLSYSFGVQQDVEAGFVNNQAYWGTGTHLFWRDPSVGLLGLTYSYQHWSNVDLGYINNSQTPVIKDAVMHRGGVEGELYLLRFTLSGRGGYQDGTVKADGYGHLKLRYYATDDLVVYASGDHFTNQNLIRGGMEYRPNLDNLSGLSVFAEGGYGSYDYGMAQVGIRYYFGTPATLIDRDRHSDPETLFVQVPFARPAAVPKPPPPPVVAPPVVAPPVVAPPVVAPPVVAPPVVAPPVVAPPVVAPPVVAPPVVAPPVVAPPVVAPPVVAPPVVASPVVAPPVVAPPVVAPPVVAPPVPLPVPLPLG
jgi:hypothetical protein